MRAFFIRRGMCASPSMRRRAPNDRTRIRREAHGPCHEGSEVMFHAVEGGGHVWPGGDQYLPKAIIGRGSQELDASRVLWEFFQRSQLP